MADRQGAIVTISTLLDCIIIIIINVILWFLRVEPIKSILPPFSFYFFPLGGRP